MSVFKYRRFSVEIILFSMRRCSDESWNLTSNHPMSPLQHLSSALADDDAGGHRVAGRHPGHAGSVRDTKIISSTDLQLGVYHRHRISPHLGGRGLMGIAHGCVTNKTFKDRSF
jgi:hypothetical protein